MRLFSIAVSVSCCMAFAPMVQAGNQKLPITTIGPVASGHAGMVVSSNSDAARVGSQVLAQGGNAVDAAIAMEFALNVSEPAFSGITGGGFMLIYEAATGKVKVIDSRERAPASAFDGMFLQTETKEWPLGERKKFGIAVGVPGALAGAQEALDLFGTWSLKQTLAPAVELAEGGVIVSQLLGESIAANLALLAANPAAKAVFLPGGKALKAGDLLVQPDLAHTLRLVQKEGIDAMYGGELGEALIEEIQMMEHPSGMTIEDLVKYEVTIDKPVTGSYGDYKIASAALPSSGGLTVLQTLAILDLFDLEQYSANSVTRYHLILRALQLAFADRNAYLGDVGCDNCLDIPFEHWLDPAYIASRAKSIDQPGCLPGPVPGSTSPSQQTVESAGGETTHLTVVDRWGNVVAFTTTIEQVFGTGRMLPGYGLMINNELTDFNSFKNLPNSVQPDKRPMSSIAPSIVFNKDGKPVLTLGSPGGPRIIGAVVLVLSDILDLGLDLQTAVSRPRVFSSSCTAKPNVRWDPGFPDDVRAGLEALGMVFEAVPQEVGNVNLIAIDGKTYTGAADPRREGVAIGLTDGPGKPKKDK